MQIKESILDYAVVLFNCVPFQNGNFYKRKEFTLAPRGCEFFPLRTFPFGMENHFYHIGLPPLNVTVFITHVCNCLNGSYTNGDRVQA